MSYRTGQSLATVPGRIYYGDITDPLLSRIPEQVLERVPAARQEDERKVTVPVNLSIKNVPEELAERLRRRAAASHRSMQGELMAILEQALEERRPLTPTEVLERVRALGVETQRAAAADIRNDRDLG
jgi:plasmid stability protein